MLAAKSQVALALAILLLPLQGSFVITAGAHFQPSEIIVLLLIGAALARWLLRHRQDSPRLRPLLVAPLLIFTTVVAASSLQTFGEYAALHRFSYLLEYQGGRMSPDSRSFITAAWALYCLAAYLTVHRMVALLSHVRVLVRLLLIGASAASIYGVIQFAFLQRGWFISMPGDVFHFSSTQGALTRAYSTFTEPATFGAFIVMILPISLVLLGAGSTSVASRKELLAHVVVQLCGLAVTVSVGQWLAAAMVLSIVVVLGFIRKLRLAPALLMTSGAFGLLLALGSAVVVATGVIDGDKVVAQFSAKLSNADLSLGTRVLAARIGLMLFQAHPLLGIGLGNFPFFFTSLEHELGYNVDIAFGGPTIITPANIYILFLAETGLLGSLAGLNVLVRMARSVWATLGRPIGAEDESLLFALGSGSLAIGVIGLFLDNLFSLSYWIIAALLMSTIRALSTRQGRSWLRTAGGPQHTDQVADQPGQPQPGGKSPS